MLTPDLPDPAVALLRERDADVDPGELDHNAHVDVLRAADLMTRPGMSRGARKRARRQAARQGLDTLR